MTKEEFAREFDEAMLSPEALARDEAMVQRSALRMADLERLKHEFIKEMVWVEATEGEKSLVLGNLNGFVSFVTQAWGGDISR
jgi:hypothetical protein